MEVTREDQDMTVPAAAPDVGAAEAPALGPLSRLIQEVNDSGDSYQRMADRAVDATTGDRLIVKQYLQKLAKRPPAKAPTEKELRGIALATRQPLRLVQKAAAEQYLGYVATELSGYGDDVRRIVGHLESMSQDEVARWRAMMEAAERSQRQGE